MHASAPNPLHAPSQRTAKRRRVKVMELRKDPITRSWVICGDEPEAGLVGRLLLSVLPRVGLAPGGDRNLTYSERKSLVGAGGRASASAPTALTGNLARSRQRPLRQDAARRRARSAGGECPPHDRHLWNADDRRVEEYLAPLRPAHSRFEEGTPLQVHQRLQELWQPMSGQEFDHPDLGDRRHHLRSATRAIRTEGRRNSIIQIQGALRLLRHSCGRSREQKLRVIEVRGDYMAGCP